jgi:hypothetical protein
MATAYLTRQVQGTASTGTYATLYSTDGSKTAIVSGITICNESSSSVTIRIGLDTTAGTPASGEFIVYDGAIAGNDTLVLNLPLTMGNTTFLRVSSSATTCTFTAGVAEVS